jgi:hypothetical protein
MLTKEELVWEISESEGKDVGTRYGWLLVIMVSESYSIICINFAFRVGFKLISSIW